MKNYCGRDALDVYLMRFVMRSGKHTDEEIGMFIIYNRLYTDEIPAFIEKYLPGYDKDGMEVFKHRWMYFENEKKIAEVLNIETGTVKAWLRVWRSNMDSALRAAYKSGDFTDNNKIPNPADNTGISK